MRIQVITTLNANIALVLLEALAAQNSLAENSVGILLNRAHTHVVDSVPVALDAHSLARLLEVHAGHVVFLLSCGDM